MVEVVVVVLEELEDEKQVDEEGEEDEEVVEEGVGEGRAGEEKDFLSFDSIPSIHSLR